jgi:transglutaminase-like putative cysteine protease/tetratricopeptide (TPR) repeat protein
MRSFSRHFVAAAATLLLAVQATAAMASGGTWRDSPAFAVPTARLLEAAAGVKRERPTDVVILLDERIYELDEQHRVTVRSRMIYRVDSPAGVENWAASSASWQPWYQERPRIRARVITTDGREHLIDQGLLRDAGTRSGDNQIYDDSHILQGPLPAIEIGAVVEEQIEVRDEKPFFAAGSVYREYIGRPVPVLLTRVVIDAPESLPVRRTTRLLPNAEVTETRANGRVRWVLEQGALDEQRAMDSNLPPERPGWASVEFSTAPSWQAVAANYLALTEPRIRPDDARPLLSSLPGSVRRPTDAATRREFIARVVERLHQEVRYTGVEFGESRLIPAFPAETLRRKFGDCKDKSTLLVAALRAADIEAHLALLSAGNGQDVTADLPGLGMFDHAIVHIPAHAAGGEPLWIDATTEYARVGTLPPADTDRLALIIREGEQGLTRTPRMRSEDNAQVETRTFHLAEYGPARIVETTETRGTVELEYRSWYAGADTKERLDSLAEYARTAYRARTLSHYTHTSSTDFSKFYSMTLDIQDAPVGSTDLTTAAVGVNLGGIVSRLPAYFSQQLESGLDVTREADVVFEPYIIEWRYHVNPPDGFRARPLPANNVMALGPARLSAEFAREPGGAVRATWRFDTVKDRYSPEESQAFVKAVQELRQRQMTLIAFDHEGAARRAEGDFKGTLEAYRTLVTRHPKLAVHRIRHAYALLEAGLGTRAHDEARAATRLSPRDAFAWKSLGWMLQHDAVGRRFGAGFDREGAIAAYRKASEIEPANTDITADLGVLLEHDAQGVRYADPTGVELAVVEYRRRATHLEDENNDRYTDNLYYALLHLRRFAEVRDGLRALAPSSTRRALWLVGAAGAEGSAAAIKAASETIGSESDRRAALKSAGGVLTNLREYALAADLLEASARGQATTAAETQRVALLRKVDRDARESVRADDPRGVVLKAYALLLSGERKVQEWRALGSRHALQGEAADRQFDELRRRAHASLARHEMPPAAAADLVFASLRVTLEGDDARGYRAQLRNAGPDTNYYVVREAGTYKLLALGPAVGALALAALEQLDAGHRDAARQWLDWARLEQNAETSADPLAGHTLARFWTVGISRDAEDIRTGAALLLADSQLAEPARALLRDARRETSGERGGLSVDLALARVHEELEQWPELESVASRLLAAWPDSGLAFHLQQWARIRMKRYDEADEAARARLARLPDDPVARRALAQSADARGATGEMAAILGPVVEGPRAAPEDFNEYAWTSLMSWPVPERVVDIARQAYDETQGGTRAITHTLACVYAATGKPREARDLLLKSLTRAAGDTPDDSAWYGFGLIAEAYGDVASARDYYARVEKPEDAYVPASSLYAMSRARLRALK